MRVFHDPRRLDEPIVHEVVDSDRSYSSSVRTRCHLIIEHEDTYLADDELPNCMMCVADESVR